MSGLETVLESYGSVAFPVGGVITQGIGWAHCFTKRKKSDAKVTSLKAAERVVTFDVSDINQIEVEYGCKSRGWADP